MINFDEYMSKYYLYKATVLEVHDGDTITCDIDLGFDTVLRRQKIRFFGVAAPEVVGAEKPKGILSRDFLRDQIMGAQVDLFTVQDKKEKYGRWLGIIVKDNIVINKLLIDKGFATEYV
jgi:micrococcal nuclease